MNFTRKKIFLILTIPVLLAVTWFAGRTYFLDQLKLKLEEKLQSLRKTGLHVEYDSITIDWKRNSVEVFNLSIRKNAYDTTCIYPEFIAARHVRAEGFGLFTFLTKKQVSFDEIDIQAPHIVMRKNSSFFEDSVDQKNTRDLGIRVKMVRLGKLHIEYTDSSSCKTLFALKANASVSSVALHFDAERKGVFDFESVRFDSTIVHLPGEFYTFTIKEMRLDLPLGIFDMDTLRIIPHYNKTVFARNKVYEADRVDGIVPYFNITGLKLYHQDTLWIDAKKATTQAFLKIYRDKRLPMKAVRKPLPSEMIRALNFGLSLEKLIVNKSYVEYEEFLEDADSSGFVFFDDLYATISGIDNTNHANDGSILLNAEGALMGQGKVKIKANFPRNPRKKNTMKGTVTDFKIPTINTILEPAAQIKAESGYLHSLAFQFTYDDEHAQGEIELNYNDLKLSTFKVVEVKHSGNNKRNNDGEDNEEVKRDGLKSFILNTFIIRKHMDEKVPEDKRTGTISFNRDQRKSVFNYWWKSVFSGVKSAYKIDKLEEKKAKRLERKNKEK